MRTVYAVMLSFVAATAAADKHAPPAREGLRDHSYGKLHDAASVTQKQVAASFPGCRIELHVWDEGSEKHRGFIVWRGDTEVARVRDTGIQFLDPVVATDGGIRPGSMFEELQRLYPRLECRTRTITSEKPSCTAPSTQVEFVIALGLKVAAKNCAPDGPACCETNGICNAAALVGARVTELRFNFSTAGL